ncbi:MAG: cysteine desulfurase [Patescibacteria group bacterium]|nr:cysteine desulfurase [Patescibacteria group bacterium]MCL5261686.1 cysteine desulfurase [Patescibacteria group bacterium]
MNRIYLDAAATTPLDKAVLKAMTPYFSDRFGNPGAIHYLGQEAMRAVDESRGKIIELLAGDILEDFRNVIFTGSATEANNLALRGSVRDFYNLKRNEKYLPVKIIVSATEHDSVLKTAEDLEAEGVEVVYLPVDKKGLIDVQKLKQSLDERTAVVSVHYVNNETGAIENVKEIGGIVREYRESFGGGEVFPLFHMDAVQAFQYFDCSPEATKADLVTLSGHKMFGPKGVGVLYFNRIVSRRERQAGKIIGLKPIITGGGQEFGLRSGTENVPAIVGFSAAAKIASRKRKESFKKVSILKDYFSRSLKALGRKVALNTPPGKSSPHILNVRFPGMKSEEMIGRLDMLGVAASAGSACSSRSLLPSHVLLAMGLSEKEALESVRFSFSRELEKADLAVGLKAIKKILG